MATVTTEQAHYIIMYYSKLLTLNEAKALRHYRSTIKLDGLNDDRLKRMYYKTGWMSADQEILDYLDEGYIPFILKCAERILKGTPGEVFFNLCPLCDKLALTPNSADIAGMIGTS